MDDFAVFICTHGRPNEQHTYEALRKAGYTGTIFCVLDNEDEKASDYMHISRDWDIAVFDKQHFIDHSETGTSEDNRHCILYAKNYCESAAKMMSLKSFVIADDDITGFRYRYESDGKLLSQTVTKNMDDILMAYSDFMLNGNIAAMSFGDVRLYIGGRHAAGRIPYNFVFRNASAPFEWKSSMYEDTVTPLLENNFGHYTMSLPFIQLCMNKVDAGADGGMTKVYESMPLYKRAMAAKIFSPSCIHMKDTRVGFSLREKNAYPRLISSYFKDA